MGLGGELDEYMSNVVSRVWEEREGRVVPDSEDLPQRNVAVKLDATVLYADLANSTAMTRENTAQFAAEVYKGYLYCASRIIKDCGGTITAFDGDRVMGVFVGSSKNTDAAKAGLQINWVTQNIVAPKLRSFYGYDDFTLEQRVGIDTSELFVVKSGVRGSNDLVWVGDASNNAAKIAALPTRYATYITSEVYSRLNASSKYGGDANEDMWTLVSGHNLSHLSLYGSNWHWMLP